MLSTISVKLCCCASFATARISVTFNKGLVGVSIKIAFVAGVIAASIAAWSAVSTKLTLILFFAKIFVIKRYVPPYTSSVISKWSPASNNCITAWIAAIPEAKAKPLLPCSIAAIKLSTPSRVGLPVRPYSYVKSPTLFCLNVLA